MTIPSVTAGGWWLVADLSGYDVHTAGWAQARTQPGYRDTGKLGAHTLYLSTYLPHSAYLLYTHVEAPDSHTTPIQSVFVTPNFCKSLWVQAAGRGASSVFMLSLRLHFPIGCARLLRECSRVNAVKAVCLGPGSHGMAHK